MKRLLALVTVLALLPSSLSGCGLDPCSKDKVQAAMVDVKGVAQHFDDADALANKTPRSGLPGVISEMQSVRRDAQALKLPDCMKDVQDTLVAYMDAKIDVYVTFLDANNSDTLVNSKADFATAKFNNYEDALNKLSQQVK